MISNLFSTFIYDPLYNGLIFLISIVPFADVGIAVILLTLIVKIIIFPLAHKSIKTQAVIKLIDPQLQKVKEKYKKDRQEQAKKTMELYREYGINPLSGILLIFIQIPIIFGLYWVFVKGGLPDIDAAKLYSFVSSPENIKIEFLGLIDMAGRSILLALIAGGTQFIHTRLAFPKPKPRPKNPTLKDDMAHSFQIQMRYVLPVIVGVIAYTISAAVALYWATSNVFSIGQEIFVRRKIMKNAEEKFKHGRGKDNS